MRLLLTVFLLLLATTASAGGPYPEEGGGGAFGFSSDEWLQIGAGEHPRFHYIHKFGNNPTVAAEETLWDCPELSDPGNTSFATARDAIFSSATNLWVSSTSALDTQDITVYGLSATNEMQQATVSLSGVSFVALTGATLVRPDWPGTASSTWNFVYRATVDSSNTGEIYIHNDSDGDTGSDGIPDTATTMTAACIDAGLLQTQMSVFQVPAGTRAHYLAHEAGLTGTGSANGSAILRAGYGNVLAASLRQVFRNGISSNHGIDHHQTFPRVWPAGSLFEMRYTPTSGTHGVYSTFDLLLERQ